VRNLATAAAGVALVLALPAALALDATVRYARSSAALVESARSAHLRESLVDATAALVVGEVAGDPTLAAVDRAFVRGAVDHVLSATWFDGTVRSVHRAVLEGTRPGSGTAGVDLEPFKQALELRLGVLEELAGDSCRQVFGDEACRDHGRASGLLTRYRQRARRAIARVPDRLFLWSDAGAAVDLGRLSTARWIAFALALAAAFALVAVNRRRPRVIGAILLAASGLFLAVALAMRAAASGPVAAFLLRRAGIRDRVDAPVRVAADGLRRLAHEVVVDATHTGVVLAIAIALAGAALLAASHVSARRRADRAI
jgi:hypothetical protein